MHVQTPIRPAATSDASTWDWRRDLKALDAQLSDVERQNHWDWRRELADLERRLEELAAKHGLAV